MPSMSIQLVLAQQDGPTLPRVGLGKEAKRSRIPIEGETLPLLRGWRFASCRLQAFCGSEEKVIRSLVRGRNCMMHSH